MQHTAAMPCANFHYIRNHHFCENLGDGRIIVLSTLQGGSDSECHEVVTNHILYQGSVAVISLRVRVLKQTSLVIWIKQITHDNTFKNNFPLQGFLRTDKLSLIVK